MLRTVTGMIDEAKAGRILVHEHIMVGFEEDGKLSESDYDRAEVVALIEPLLVRLREAGGSTLFDCAPEYLGRDPYLLKQLSLNTGVNLVTNTGYYKRPYLPPFVLEASDRELANRWIAETKFGIGDSGVYPGFIKIALNDGEVVDETQQKLLRAAMLTSMESGLAIQCHTIGGKIALHANELMRKAGFDRERFVWIHAQTCEDISVIRSLADEGMWISIDSIVPGSYDKHVELLKRLIEHGLGDRVLLSQDTGWYTVGQPLGGSIKPYHHLIADFLPYAADRGMAPRWLERCVTVHPFQAMRIRS